MKKKYFFNLYLWRIKMSADLFTILVQIFNFIILIIILNKLLFQPIIKNIEERRQEIKKEHEDLETKLLEAEKEKNLFQQKTKEFEQIVVEEKNRLNIEIEETRKNKLTKLELEAKNKEDSMLRSIEEKKQTAINNASKIICTNISDLLSNILTTIADINLQQQIILKFAEQIKNLTEEQTAKIRHNIDNNYKIKFFYSYNLEKNEKDLIKDALKNREIDIRDIEFIQDKDLLLGIKLEIGSMVMSSNVQEIIEHFNIKLKEIL